MARIPQPTLTLNQAKVALQEVLDAFVSPVNQDQLFKVKEESGNDIVKLVQLTLPLAAQIQQDVIKNYGFTADGEGILSFTHIIKAYEDQDEELRQMVCDLKSKFIPALPRPPLLMQAKAQS